MEHLLCVGLWAKHFMCIINLIFSINKLLLPCQPVCHYDAHLIDEKTRYMVKPGSNLDLFDSRLAQF